MLDAVTQHESCPGRHESVFAAPPIDPLREMCAYESLWMGQGAWFAKIADLFRDNPGCVPSELVPAGEVSRVCDEITKLLGSRLREIGLRINGAGEYPARLRDADHPVEVLYYRGNWELVDTPCVAVVGTRTPSPEGAANAARIAQVLSREKVTVVSGLAQGVDTIAHNAALDVGGRTIGVIGTPLYSYYPRENEGLQERIADQHLLISQVPFLRYRTQHFKVNRLFFPARNVTMSALTRATIIVEAGNTSGTLVQARAALAQKRKLLILDSCFRRGDLTWPAKYEAMGAVRVRTISDILRNIEDVATPTH